MGLILTHYMDVTSEQRTRPQTMKNVKIDVLYLSLLQFLHLTGTQAVLSDKESKR